MPTKMWERRDFLKSVLAAIPMVAFDWDSFPRAQEIGAPSDQFDAVIIGAGLGGLSCAAAFARQGFKPLILEQHDRPGGYATTFKRPGGFVFDVSLHSTTVGQRDGVYNLIPGFPEITDVEFVPHPALYRAIFPDYDIRVPQKDLPGYIDILTGHFPEEHEGIAGLFDEMKGLAGDVKKFSGAGSQIDMNTFPVEFPHLFKNFNRTWGEMVNARIADPKLKTVISALWGYYGLPPSKLASIYYALPTIEFLQSGGYYPRGRSQQISNALVSFIEERGGQVLLKTRVAKILLKDQTAYGVKTDNGREYTGKVVVSNANAYDTFHTMMDESEYLKDYLARMDQFTTSLSSFQVFLGLNKNLVGELGITDTEIFYEEGYDPEAAYQSALNAEVEKSGFGMMLYDNLYPGYSPEGKNTLTIMTLQGYDFWEQFKAGYWRGRKTAYNAEKERMAAILIKKAEERLLPGLVKAVEVQEIGTPLTNIRFTGNHRGAIYGWDQTLDNSGRNRLPHKTPIGNLFLSGAWTSPGGGYSAVLWSGLECFSEIMNNW